MLKKAVIFDLDGTLWDASTKVVPAWNIVLNKHSELDKQITIEDMRGFMGKRIEVIAKMMLPNLDPNDSLKILKECCNYEQVYLRKNGGILYPNLEEILNKLKEQYLLYIVSNCQDGYVQAFLEYHKLGKYFSDIEMSGRTGKNKGENIKMIIERNNLDKSVYVGDTNGDLEGAVFANIPFIHASYGFGKLDDIEYSINDISELCKVVDEILK